MNSTCYFLLRHLRIWNIKDIVTSFLESQFFVSLSTQDDYFFILVNIASLFIPQYGAWKRITGVNVKHLICWGKVILRGKAKVHMTANQSKEFIHYFPSAVMCLAISRKSRTASHVKDTSDTRYQVPNALYFLLFPCLFLLLSITSFI